MTYLKSITYAKVIIFHSFLLSFLFSQNYKSIHQQQFEYYNANYVMPERVDTNTVINPISDRTRNISKEVFGYHPYWMGTSWTSYNFNLISTLAYFSAEVTSTGGLGNLHGWPVASLINEAHEHGTKVVLCATLFNSSDITTLLSSAQYRQNLIDNLLFQVQAGNADGVNIDFESFPASQRNNMITFITDLTETFHNVIPGSQVTLATPPVDWSNAWDYNALASISDGLFIMGYNYHWSGSPNTGPNSPLSGPNYTLEWTISDYLNKTNFQFEKLILGIPYYGYEWPSSSELAGAATSGLGSAKFYTEMEGFALSYDKQWHPESQTPWYRYNNNGWNQGWYDDSLSLSLKYDFTLSIGLKGVGIWALGYDNGRQELWDLLRLKFEGQDLEVKNDYNNSSPSTLINTIFPNPSNSSIVFSFNIPDIEKINQITIYDILGNQIFSEKRKFNNKSILWRWEGKNKFGSKLPSGVYYVTLKNDKFIDMKKITLLK